MTVSTRVDPEYHDFMEVLSLGSLPVASLLWQPRPGAWMFTFVCKATYSLRPGESPLAAEQQPLNKVDRHWHDNPAHSLMAPTDITPLRPRTDVVLVGSAFATGGGPVRSLVARLAVADIDKRIEVHCDRLQNRNGAIHEGPPFSQMSLAYERAAGGPDSMNPVGMRPDAWDANGNRKLPNLQAPGSHRQGTMNRAEVDGFGPIAPSWPSRRYRLGSHAPSWSDTTWHRQPLPEFDRSYFNAAPSDQQTQKLEDNARITLENLHPEHAQFVTSLPGIHPHAFIRRPDRIPESAQIGIDLLWIHTDKAVCTLTWRGQVPLESPQDEGVVLVAVESPGERLTWEDVARLMSRGASVVGSGARFGGVGETVAPPVPTSAAPAVNPLKGTVAPLPNAAAPGNATPFTKQPGDAPPSGQGVAPAQRLTATPFGRPGEPPQNLESTGSWNISPRTPAPVEAPLAQTEPPPPPVSAPQVPPVSFGTSPMPPPSFGIPPAELVSETASVMSAPTPVAAPPAVIPTAAGVPPISPPPLVRGPEPAAPPLLGMLTPAPAPPEPAAAQGASLSIGQRVAAGSVDIPARWHDPLGSPSPSTPVRREADERPPAIKDAAGGGALSASNAAAQAAGDAAPARLLSGRAPVELVWLNPGSTARIRKQTAWKGLLSGIKPRPEDEDLDDDLPPARRIPAKDRREVVTVLSRGEPLDAVAVEDALQQAMADEEGFTPPLVLATGELEMRFDELESLKALLASLSPHVPGDKRLEEAVARVQEAFKMPWTQGASAVLEEMADNLRKLFYETRKGVQAELIDSQTERVLLEGRHYRKRTVFGQPRLVGALTSRGMKTVIPAYLPDTLAKELPSMRRLPVRLIAEVRPRAEQTETSPVALRVVVLGRVLGAGW